VSTVVATAALLPMPPKAWISLVLVTASRRRQGLASALMARCVAAAEALGLTPWLDATPAGAAVYGKMGFVDVGEGLLRLRRAAGIFAPGTSDDDKTGLDRLIEGDRRAMATDRAALLTSLAARPSSCLYAHDGAVCLVRDGRTARHIGPLVARDEAAAIALIDHVLARERGPLVIDIRETCAALAAHLAAATFAVERPFRRMRRGHDADGALTPFASAGPEYG